MNDISGFGARIQVVADRTFPAGFSLSQFADDSDPFDTPSIKTREVGMGLNGDMVHWAKATPVPVTLAVIPNSEDDLNLQALYDANRVGKGKASAGDTITLTVVYADGKTRTFQRGVITDGPGAVGIAQAGRLKTSTYQLAFESVVRAA